MSGIRKGALLLVILSILNVLLLAADDTGTHDYSINLNEGANLRGVAQVYVSGSEGAVFTLKVNDAVLLPSEKEPEIRMIYRGGDGNPDRDIKTDSTYNASNTIGINGRNLGRFPSDGSKGYAIPTSRFEDGENAIFVMIGGFWGDGPYNERRPHGLAAGYQGKNKDDFLLSNVKFILPDGSVVIPDGFVSYKAEAVGSLEKVVTRYVPYPFAEDEYFWLGDGWGSYDTWAGNTTDKTRINSVDLGRYDIPYKVEFLLNYKKPGSEAIFEIDTTKLADGRNLIEVYDGDKLIFARNVVIDNTPPKIETNLANLKIIYDGFVLEGSISDEMSQLKTASVRLEGTEIASGPEFSYQFNGLNPGVYSLIIEASDEADNTVYQSLYFIVADKPSLGLKSDALSDGSYVLSADEDSTISLFNVDLLDYEALYGTSQDMKDFSTNLPAPDFLQPVKGGTGKLTTKSAAGIPYHLFTIDVENRTSGTVLISYKGKTLDGERLALKVYDPKTDQFTRVAYGYGEVDLTAEVDIASYATSGKIYVLAVPDYVTNGSDTFLWITDPQHYTKFDDLNDFYYKIHQYAAAEYRAGRIGYVVNTGDLVDDSPSSSKAPAQWEIADRALSYLDEAGVPNGVVTGNHDTDNYPSTDYSLFWQHFGADRYRNEDFYGGSLNNNASHFDLVTIGNTDFIFLYLGYGVEGTPETVAWANQVLEKYRHRNAIICTHQYLKATTGTWDETSRANVIFNEIVVPNENVIMLLCGHSHGAVTLQKIIGDRTFYEILSDYQFIQVEPDSYYNGNKHYIGDVAYCNGEGYLRSMTITGNTVATTTFSPVTGGANPFGNRDQFTLNVDFAAPSREITTTFFSVAVIDTEISKASLKKGEKLFVEPLSTPAVAVAKGSKVTTFTSPLFIPEASAEKAPAHIKPVDLLVLEALVKEKSSLNREDYITSSFERFTSALKAAEEVLKKELPHQEEVAASYLSLVKAAGLLAKKSDGAIDPADLVLLYDFDLSRDSWQNASGPASFDHRSSYLKATNLEDGGLVIEKTEFAPNNWPQMVYKTANIPVTLENGKLYLDLDISAGSAWVIYPRITQNGRPRTFRVNYAIEGFAQREGDGGPGMFRGVYDISQTLIDVGIDPTQPMEITMMINAVPGPITINHLAVLTDKPSEEAE